MADPIDSPPTAVPAAGASPAPAIKHPANYQVLARKWRPQQFAEVSGQEHVVRTLTNAVANGRVAHAYLFCGPRGVGKTTAARLLARALNCEKGPTAEPCGVCAGCTEIAAGSSVDVAEIDGASNNGVDDVRAIRENARYLPARDRFKIYIIDEVHSLSGAAFNALLKTLEEPPPHVKFIFATTEAHKVPETIVSRCQLFTFRRIPLAQVVARLRAVAAAEGFQLAADALSTIARQAEGGMRDALSLLDQVVSACGDNPSPEAVASALGAVERRGVLQLVEGLVQRDAAAVVAVVGEQFERGTDPKMLAQALCQELRALLVCRLSGKPPADLPDHEQREVAALAQKAEAPQLTRLFELCHETLGDLGKAFDPRLALEVALLKGVYLAPGASVVELLERAEALAKGLPAPASTAAGAVVLAAKPKFEAAPPAAPPGPNNPRAMRGAVIESAAEASASLGKQPLPSPAPPGPEQSSVVQPASPPLSSRAGNGRPLAPANLESSVALAAVPPVAVAVVEVVAPAARGPVVTLDTFARAAAAITRASPRLGTAIKNGRPRGLDAGRVVLAFPPGDFRASLLQAERPEAERWLSQELGGAVRLELVEGVIATDPPSLAERDGQGEAARIEQLKETARSSSAVRDAVRILGGTVEEIRVLSEGKSG